MIYSVSLCEAEGRGLYIFFTTIWSFYFFLKTSIIRYMVYLFFLWSVLCGLLIFFSFSHMILLLYINEPSLNTYRTTYVLLASASLS